MLYLTDNLVKHSKEKIMLYLAEVTNDIANLLVLTEEAAAQVNDDYYHKPHGNSSEHILHSAIAFYAKSSTLRPNNEEHKPHSVRTGCRYVEDTYVAYTSCAGNMAIVFKGWDKKTYIGLHGARHGLSNPIHMVSELIGIDISRLEQRTVFYKTNAPSASPFEYGVEDKAGLTKLINNSEEDWVGVVSIVDAVNDVMETQEILDLINTTPALYVDQPGNERTLQNHVTACIKAEACVVADEAVLNSVRFEDLSVFNTKHYCGESTSFNGMTVKAFRIESGSMFPFIKRVYISQGTGVYYVLTLTDRGMSAERKRNVKEIL